ncbi:PREDICTED: histone deacetylase 6-like [Capra hircus]|uniref:histone deacetylase 6-like n=1 Tax=Capra hircus TaxID=9925 RepID=UPI000847991A|nr:PREDICTED: histone deacetylase 6-like [Capra hircus]
MTSTGQDSTTPKERRSRHNPHSPTHDSSITSKRGIKKGAMLRSSPSLAEVKKKGRMKKLRPNSRARPHHGAARAESEPGGQDTVWHWFGVR